MGDTAFLYGYPVSVTILRDGTGSFVTTMVFTWHEDTKADMPFVDLIRKSRDHSGERPVVFSKDGRLYDDYVKLWLAR